MSQNPRGRTRSYLPATRTFRLGGTADIASQSPGQAGRQPSGRRVAVAADSKKCRCGQCSTPLGTAPFIPRTPHLKFFTSSRRRAASRNAGQRRRASPPPQGRPAGPARRRAGSPGHEPPPGGGTPARQALAGTVAAARTALGV